MSLIPDGYPGFSSLLTNVDEMKDLWCSSSLAIINTNMNECEGSICLNLKYPVKEAEGNSQ